MEMESSPHRSLIAVSDNPDIGSEEEILEEWDTEIEIPLAD